MNLQNLIDYSRYADIDIFEGVAVPAPLNAETVKSAIMIRCGLLTPVYGEPEVFRESIRLWFKVKQWTFEHLIKIVQAEYSPIENFDRYEDYSDENSGQETEARSGKYTDTHSGTDKEVTDGSYSTADEEKKNNNHTTENTVSAFNSTGYQADTRVTESGNENRTLSEKNSHEDERSFTHGHKLANTHSDDLTRTSSGGSSHTGHLHGNIGVTTNQQMIEQELELLRHFDIYGWIAEQFEEDHMLMIY